MGSKFVEGGLKLALNNIQLVRHLYERFNARDIDGVLASVTDDVAWANGMEGGHVHGREAIRDYWTQQWLVITPRVEPLSIAEGSDGSVVVEVHQIVHDLSGKLLLDEKINHIFQIKEGRVARFDIQGASELSKIKH